MLNGIDPIIIFQFAKLSAPLRDFISKIPLVADIPTVLDLPPIPVYLSQTFTGIQIDSESKNIDIETDMETKSDGSTPAMDQKGISSIVTINMTARKDSIAFTLLSSLTDIVLEKVTSKEYSITYLHGPITVFRGVLHSFNVDQNANTDILTVKIELSKGTKQPTKPNAVPTIPSSEGNIPAGLS